MNIFQKVNDFNKQFGVKQQPKINLDDVQFINSRMDLIREEVEELEESIKTKNEKETIDALTDILYVVCGMAYSINIDLEKAFNIVHESNMSKMCTNEADAQKTVDWYKHHELRYKTPTYRPCESSGNFVVYDENTKKVLKSIYYKPADLSSLL
jgi:predicted HAD superfamily Cof-like phosphohydrolase